MFRPLFEKKEGTRPGWGGCLLYVLLAVELSVGAGLGSRVGGLSGHGSGCGGHSGALGVAGGLAGGAVQQLDALDAESLLALAVAVGVHVGGGADGVHGHQLDALVQQRIDAVTGIGRHERLKVDPVDAVLAVGALVVLPNGQGHQNLLGTVAVHEDLGVAAQTADGDTEVTRIDRHSDCLLSSFVKIEFWYVTKFGENLSAILLHNG